MCLKFENLGFSHSYQIPYSPERTHEALLREEAERAGSFRAGPKEGVFFRIIEVPLASGFTFFSLVCSKNLRRFLNENYN